MDLRPVLFIAGILLTILSLSMVVPMLADLYFHKEDWKVFFICIVITAFFGGSLILSNTQQNFTISTRQAFLLTTASWLVLAIFASLPFYLCELDMSLTDSFFEAMSGITTTGATVIQNLHEAPPGILLWRAILQWLGGIGIIIMALSVLPFLKVGGMQIFRTELSESEKALPRVTQLASSIGSLYLAFTILCTICYMASGWQLFDALAHALTTISTGGFSTFNSSFAAHQTVWHEIVCIIFMLIGSLPFVLYLRAIRGNFKPLYQDEQVQGFLSFVILSIAILLTYLILSQNMNFGEALLQSSFNVISIVTGTGYTNADYSLWGNFAIGLFFFLMVVGGCAGSTTCGIKIFRFQVLYLIVKIQIKKLLHPHGVFNAHYNGKPIPSDVPMSVMSFFFVFALFFSLIVIALSFTGMSFIDAMSGAASTISNVGPALGSIGPASTYAHLSDSAKWILSGSMILGRLEIFTILIMFYPPFWQK